MNRLTFTQHANRRAFLRQSGVGLGALALGSLFQTGHANSTESRTSGALGGLPHHTPTVKRVIYLFMAGGPSQLETYDMI